jgi:hypothetical protein
MSFTGKLISFAALSSLTAAAALAESLPPSVAACASEKDSLARLVCFDREVAKYTQAAARVAPTPATPVAPPPPAPGVAATQPPAASPDHDDFGVNATIIRQRNEAKPPEQQAPKQMRAAITKIATKPFGELILTLDNGQVWEQPEHIETFIIKVGDGVVIKQGKLGSFLLTADSGATTRIRRIH